MSSLCHCDCSTDYVDLPGADDFVHADLLKETINDGLCCCISAIIDRLDMLTRGDDQLQDNLIRARMLAPEVKNLFPGFGSYYEVQVATTGPVTLAGLYTVDGELLSDGQNVLVRNQADARQNGVYIASAGLWIRAEGFAEGDTLAEPVHVWVVGGSTYLYSSWMTAVSGTPLTIGPSGSEIGWVRFHQEYIPDIDADIMAALAGTEGDPSAANLFVTDDDPRLDPFTDTQDGLVPAPGMTSTCARFLCEDGSWSIPAEAAISGVMLLDADNTMGPAGAITFPDAVGIHGLDTPVADGDAANKGYVDDLIDAVNGSVGDLTTWKSDLDALDGLIACDGAGTYSAVDAVASSFSDDSVYGGGGQTIADSIDALAGLISGNASDISTNASDISTNASDIVSLENFDAALEALDGVIMCDGAGTFSAEALTADTNDYLAGDGTFQALPAAAVNEYGEMYGSDATALSVMSTWYTIGGGWSAGETNNFSASGGDTLTYDGDGGTFRVNAALGSISADTGDATPRDLEFAIFLNGSEQAKSRQTVPAAEAQERNVTLSCLLALATDDTVTVRARSTSSTSVGLGVDHCNFNIY